MDIKIVAALYFFASIACEARAQTANSSNSSFENEVNKIETAINKIETKCINWRRNFHEYPELGNREFKSAKLIAGHLKSLGLEVKEGVAHTGVVGILKGVRPGPVVGLRADMDALPVEERSNLSFATKAKGNYNNQQVNVMQLQS